MNIESLSEASAAEISDDQLDATSGGYYRDEYPVAPRLPENPLMTAFYTGVCMGLMGF